MTICTKCNERPIMENVRRPICRSCKQAYDREYWAKTKEKRNIQKKINASTTRERNRDFIYEYLLEHSCIDCKETDPIVLQFDHLDNKTVDISIMIGRSYSIKSIKSEIEKCVVRCANCHIRKTAHQFNWWKTRRAIV